MTKVFAPLIVPSKLDIGNFDRSLFAKKVAEGLSLVDAVQLAGYTGSSPASFAQNQLKAPAVKKDLGDIFERKTRTALRKMTSQKADQLDYYKLSQAAATLYDKTRLARGESTSNSVHVNVNIDSMSDEELKSYLEEKSRAVAAR